MSDIELDTKRERAVLLGPLAIPALVLIGIGVRRRRRALVFSGALLLGSSVKLIPRPPSPNREEPAFAEPDADAALSRSTEPA